MQEGDYTNSSTDESDDEVVSILASISASHLKGREIRPDPAMSDLSELAPGPKLFSGRDKKELGRQPVLSDLSSLTSRGLTPGPPKSPADERKSSQCSPRLGMSIVVLRKVPLISQAIKSPIR